MDNIKKAIERAKQEQRTIKGGRVVPAERIDNKPEASETIEYKQTSIIETDSNYLARNRIISGWPQDNIASAYKMLRTQVLHRMRENNWSTLAITSPLEGEGKTLTAINLAISLAMEVNQTILLVDMDLRRPSIHKYFGIMPEKGISDHILNDTPLSEIMFNPSMERLVILPGTKTFTNSSEMLSSPKFVNLAGELKMRYPSRLVLFDMPPLLSADDAVAFSPYVDAMLLVIEEGKTTREELMKSRGILKSTHLIGTVLNKASIKAQAYY